MIMAKSKYETHVKARFLEIAAWCRDGATDIEMMKALGIGKDAFYRYKKDNKEFSDLLKNNKEIIDIKVENALLKRALGAHETIKKVIKTKDYKKVGNEFKIVDKFETIEEDVFIAPDLAAIIFWLKNRRRDKWRDKQEIEHSGNIGIEEYISDVEDEEED